MCAVKKKASAHVTETVRARILGLASLRRWHVQALVSVTGQFLRVWYVDHAKILKRERKDPEHKLLISLHVVLSETLHLPLPFPCPHDLSALPALPPPPPPSGGRAPRPSYSPEPGTGCPAALPGGQSRRGGGGADGRQGQSVFEAGRGQGKWGTLGLWVRAQGRDPFLYHILSRP